MNSDTTTDINYFKKVERIPFLMTSFVRGNHNDTVFYMAGGKYCVFFYILDHWIKDGSKQVDRGYTKINI